MIKRVNPKVEAMRQRTLMLEQLVNPQGAEWSNITELESAIKGLGTDEEKVYKVLQNITKEEFKAMDKYFMDKYGETTEEFIMNDFGGDISSDPNYELGGKELTPEYNKVKGLIDNLK